MSSISAISGAIHTIRQLCRHRGGLPLNMHVPGPNFVNSDVDVVRRPKRLPHKSLKAARHAVHGLEPQPIFALPREPDCVPRKPGVTSTASTTKGWASMTL